MSPKARHHNITLHINYGDGPGNGDKHKSGTSRRKKTPSQSPSIANSSPRRRSRGQAQPRRGSAATTTNNTNSSGSRSVSSSNTQESRSSARRRRNITNWLRREGRPAPADQPCPRCRGPHWLQDCPQAPTPPPPPPTNRGGSSISGQASQHTPAPLPPMVPTNRGGGGSGDGSPGNGHEYLRGPKVSSSAAADTGSGSANPMLSQFHSHHHFWNPQAAQDHWNQPPPPPFQPQGTMLFEQQQQQQQQQQEAGHGGLPRERQEQAEAEEYYYYHQAEHINNIDKDNLGSVLGSFAACLGVGASEVTVSRLREHHERLRDTLVRGRLDQRARTAVHRWNGLVSIARMNRKGRGGYQVRAGGGGGGGGGLVHISEEDEDRRWALLRIEWMRRPVRGLGQS